MAGHARVVVIGGGAFGTSTAFHLAQQGVDDVLLLDRFGLADGTTWHSGGFVGQLRSDIPIMQLIAHSSQVYSQVAAASDRLDWHRVGSLRLATTGERWEEFTRLVDLAGRAGVPASLVAPDVVAELAPMLTTSDLVGAVWIPTDGYVEPDTLPQALAAAAVDAGVTVATGVDVVGIAVDTSGVVGVNTAQGLVRAEHVVVAAGFATPDVMATAGVFVPIGVSRQQYLVTHAVDADVATMPTVREPDRSQYFRALGRQILLGAITGEAGMVLPAEVPRQPRYLFEALPDGLDSALADCRHRFPALEDVAVERQVRGPEGVTADGELIADESGVPRLWVAAGGNGHGIAAAGGVGWYMASRVGHALDRRAPGPTVDGSPFALDRFPAHFESDTQDMLEAMERCELAHYHVVEAASAASTPRG